MYEVEAKIQISPRQYSELKVLLDKKATYLETRKNIDSYYEKVRNSVIRIRNRNDIHTLDLKLRRTINGVENNIEMEWRTKDPKKLRSMLNMLSIKPSIRKTKKTEAYKYKGFIIELNKVAKLGYFVEIEKIVKSPDGLAAAKGQLISIFETFGYSKKQFEKRPYLELLRNV